MKSVVEREAVNLMGENKKEESHIPLRLNILFLIVFAFFATIILRLAYVQLVEGEQYKHELEKYSSKELPIPAPRGRILDVNGVELVSNKAVFTVTFVEEQGQKINEEQVADKLANILIMDQEKTGTDKELLKKAVELNATLPVSFNKQETERLISMITPRIQALPTVESIDAQTDIQLARTALQLHLRVKSPFENNEREEVRKKLTAHFASKGAKVDLTEASDSELLRHLIHSKLNVPFSLDDKVREDLRKEVKATLRPMKQAKLSEKTDMDLLRLIAFFDLDIQLPFTEQQRQYQWRKLAILQNMLSLDVPRFIPRIIKENASEFEIAKIEERLQDFPGVNVIVEPIRKIRKDEDGSPFATHILGYISAIKPEVLDEYLAQGYAATDRIGVAGLERYYERELRGKDGVMEVHVNKNSQTVEKQERRPAEPGNDLVLALDARFQSKVEEILKTMITQMHAKNKDITEGHALVMNPQTGEVLAMANYPDYDLNIHYDRKTFNKVYKDVIQKYEENKIIRGAYPPGSTIKALSVMLALQEGLVTPQETIYDPGGLKIGNLFKRNWKAGGHGRVDARRALQVSNNTYMYEMALRLARKGNREGKHYTEQFSVVDFYNQQFGLGLQTGIDLPRELKGWRAPEEEKQLGRLADAFIGQYHNFTAIQLGQYVSTIANGGYRLRPHLVKEIRRGTVDPKQHGQTLVTMKPDVLNKVNIDPQWLKVVQEGMRRVTMQGGTASQLGQLPFSVAAKTGTAQTGRDNRDNSLIVGYAPYENPKVAFVVIVPYGGHGSDSSVPISKQILEAYHELYPLTPQTTPSAPEQN